jgi:hypothetical protein
MMQATSAPPPPGEFGGYDAKPVSNRFLRGRPVIHVMAGRHDPRYLIRTPIIGAPQG